MTTDFKRESEPIAVGKEPAHPPGRDESGAPSRSPESFAASDIDELLAERARLSRRSTTCSRVRLFSFIAVLAGVFAAFDSLWFLASLALPAALVFAVAFVLHGRVLDRLSVLETHLTLLTEAAERRATRRHRERAVPAVSDDPSSLEAGERTHAPEPPSHALDEGVVDDLELLHGRRSLFGFLDWTSTSFGARRLCWMIRHPLRRAADIVRRQEAIREIATRNELRERILLTLIPMRKHDLASLVRFFHEPPVFAGRRGLSVLANVTGTLAPLCLLAIIATGRLDLVALLVAFLVFNFVLIGFNVKESNPARDRLLVFGPLLQSFARLHDVSRSAGWESEEWKEIHGSLDAVRTAVDRLDRYVRLLSLHSYGAIFEVINVLTVWELRILPKADAMFHAHSELLEKAAGALGEAEALTCLALPLAEQTGFSMPEVVDEASAERPVVEAEAIGHPMLDSAVCVTNPLSLGQGASVWILTGSNMSGKSTYLKAVGLNVVLAGIGGAVCGSGFRWTPLALHTDVNIRDSLDDGKSYFQVEVERIRESLRYAARDPRLLMLCDEMFRGTNSDERLAISRAVVRYLRDTGALVVMATHDRSLTELVTKGREPGIANYHLRDEVRDGVMTFDYRLREGVTPTRNAIRVLERQEYPAEIVAEARRFLEDRGGGKREA